MDNVRARVFVSGRVQGVFFRAETRRNAELHNVTGWVRNLPDGRVEAVFEGVREDVEKMTRWCRRGPAYAHVDNIEVDAEQYSGSFSGFSILD